MKVSALFAPYATLWLILACGSTAFAQMSAAEHASHHATPPGGAAASPMASPATQNVPPPAGASPEAMPTAPGGAGMGVVGVPAMPAAGQPDAAAGAMGGGMAEMMKGMGTAPTKEIYPTLMALPDGINADQRLAIDQLAHERMNGGTAALSAGLEKLSNATSSQDYAAMQQATEQMREGLADFESGVAAQRVISEGKAPRNVALDWFRREMSLASPVLSDEAHGILGVTPFHLFTMLLLVGFALAMLVMYYFKMRRATALFGRLDPDKKPPPPGPQSPPSGGRGSDRPKPPTITPAGSPKPPEPGDSTPSQAPSAPESAKFANPGETQSPPESKPSTRGELSSGPDSASDTAKTARSPTVFEANAPVTVNWKGPLRISSIVTETPSVKTFRLVPSTDDHSLPFTYLPGQFLNAAFWIGGTKMIRSYSISSSPHEREHVDLTIRREPRGAVSRHIDDLLNVGDEMVVDGPVGKFTFTGTEADSIVLLSAGVGITPMMSISRFLTENSWPGDIYFLHTCRTPADFIFADKIGELQVRNPRLHVAVTVSRPEGTNWKGDRGRITKDWVTRNVPDLVSRLTHMCGPPTMMDAIKAIYAELGIASDKLKTESFGTPKPAPAAPGTGKQKGPATGPEVTFSKNDKSAKIRIDLDTGDSPPKQSILELSEELSIPIEFSCRVGTCGVCKTKMTAGDVDQEVQDALTDDEKAKGIVLACQAKPKGEVTVEA